MKIIFKNFSALYKIYCITIEKYISSFLPVIFPHQKITLNLDINPDSITLRIFEDYADHLLVESLFIQND